MLNPIFRVYLLALGLFAPGIALAQAPAPLPSEPIPKTIDELLLPQVPVAPAPIAPGPAIAPASTTPPVGLSPQAAPSTAAPPFIEALPPGTVAPTPGPFSPPASQPPAATAPAPVTPPLSEIATVNPADVFAIEYAGGPLPDGFSVLTLRLQILLDLAGMSPGIIDGMNGRNVAKAIAGVETLMGLPVDGTLDVEVWQRLPRNTPVLVEYEITHEDVAGPFLPSIPTDYTEMAKLDALSYTGPLEMFGERFHMDVELLSKLNPGADLNRVGTRIVVAGANAYAVTTPVASLIADKVNAQLRGFDAEGKLVVAYPTTIGSDE